MSLCFVWLGVKYIDALPPAHRTRWFRLTASELCFYSKDAGDLLSRCRNDNIATVCSKEGTRFEVSRCKAEHIANLLPAVNLLPTISTTVAFCTFTLKNRAVCVGGRVDVWAGVDISG